MSQNIGVLRQIGVNGVMHRIGANTNTATTVAATLTNLQSIIVPKFSFDEDGRELIMVHRGIGLGVLGTKRFRATMGTGVPVDMTTLTIANQGYELIISLTRKDFQTLLIQSSARLTYAFGGVGAGSSFQQEEILSPFNLIDEMIWQFQGQCTNAADGIESSLIQGYRI